MNTEEKKDYDTKKKQAAKAYQERKKEASAKVKAWLDSNPRVDEEIKKAIGYLVGTAKASRTGIAGELKALFIEKKNVTAMEIFEKFEYGRPKVETMLRNFIKAKDEGDRIWVLYNEETKTYELKGTGAKAPANWAGYVPPVEEEL